MSAPCSKGLDQVGRRHRVVDDERDAVLLGDRRDGLKIDDHAAGIGDGFDEDRLGLRRDGGLEARRVVRIGPGDVPAEILVGMIELVDRAAIELLGRNELVAGLEQGVEHQELGRMAGGHRESGGAAFQRRHALFQHGAGRVADSGIDVAEGLQAEQGGRMIHVVEHEGRGLVDRGRPCSRRGIRGRSGMDGERVEAWQAVGHGGRPLGEKVRSIYRTDRSFVKEGVRLLACHPRRP